MKKEIPDWAKKLRHANKGKRGVRVYYLMIGLDIVCSDIVKRVHRNTIEFLGGGWCHTKDCYLTAGQCRRGSGLWYKEAIEKAAATIGRASDALIEADARLTGMKNSLIEDMR